MGLYESISRKRAIYCQADAQHAVPPKADLFTGEIVENLMEKIKCAGVISTVSRTSRSKQKSGWPK